MDRDEFKETLYVIYNEAQDICRWEKWDKKTKAKKFAWISLPICVLITIISIVLLLTEHEKGFRALYILLCISYIVVPVTIREIRKRERESN